MLHTPDCLSPSLNRFTQQHQSWPLRLLCLCFLEILFPFTKYFPHSTMKTTISSCWNRTIPAYDSFTHFPLGENGNSSSSLRSCFHTIACKKVIFRRKDLYYLSTSLTDIGGSKSLSDVVSCQHYQCPLGAHILPPLADRYISLLSNILTI